VLIIFLLGSSSVTGVSVLIIFLLGSSLVIGGVCVAHRSTGFVSGYRGCLC
jgi:hypothetical protein